MDARDRTMTENNYDIEIMNGEEGEVTSIGPIVSRLSLEQWRQICLLPGKPMNYLRDSLMVTACVCPNGT